LAEAFTHYIKKHQTKLFISKYYYKMTIIKKLFTVALILAAGNTIAQSPVSGFMKEKGKGSVSIGFSSEKYDEVFLVPDKVKGVPVFNEVKNTAVSLYTTYGITKDIEVVFSAPYIKSKGNADAAFAAANNFQQERSGLQDMSLFFKFKSYSTKLGKSGATLDLIGTAGIQTPLGNYKVDEGLQSIIAIGNRSTKITAMGIAHIKLKTGMFFTGQMGYSMRDNKVPDAYVSELKVGYAASKIYADAYVAYQASSKKGVDILQPGFMGFFPATRVNYTRIGANVYTPVYKGLGASVGFNSYVAGRNLGASTGIVGGITYNY
jgi:hypothetical protein